MESNKRPTQVKKAIDYMLVNGSISSREAFKKEDGTKGRAKRWHIIAMPEGVTA